MPEFEYHSPKTVTEACKLLKKFKGTAKVLAGGTDIIPKMHYGQPEPAHLVNIKTIPGLNTIKYDGKSGLSLGALVRFNDIIYSDIVNQNYPELVEVSKDIASHQVRNLATVGGNLCNAAPSADSAPILIAMNSTVVLAGVDGKKRTVPLEDFFTGPGKTVLEPGEILTQINVPPIKPNTGTAYIKHTTRRALEIAVVGVAGSVQLDSGQEKCITARVVVGASAPTPIRAVEAETELVGKKMTESVLKSASELAGAAVKPISDVRSSAWYRQEIVEVQCRRVLKMALSRAKKAQEI